MTLNEAADSLKQHLAKHKGDWLVGVGVCTGFGGRAPGGEAIQVTVSGGVPSDVTIPPIWEDHLVVVKSVA
jgi:hypothetical protein